jgi:hypothetical protein
VPAVNVGGAGPSCGGGRAPAPIRSPPPREASFGSALRRSAPQTAGGPRSGSPEAPTGIGSRLDDRAPLLAPAMLTDPERPVAGPPSVHRAALAVELVRAGDRGQVEIAVHSGAVRLEAGRDGIAVTVTADSRATPSAHAELPGVVEALRRRGVRVSRAEVRIAARRRGAGGRPR